jgi:hypothetical protein
MLHLLGLLQPPFVPVEAKYEPNQTLTAKMMVTYFSANLDAWLALARTRIRRGLQFQILASPLCFAELKYALGEPVPQNNEKVQPLTSVYMSSNKYKRPFDTYKGSSL